MQQTNIQNFRTRQAEIIGGHELRAPTLLIGCGAIGSHVAHGLARLGMERVTLYDFDHVSPENMNSQGFIPSDIGANKAFLCVDYAAPFGLTWTWSDKKWNDTRIDQRIVLAHADSMAARAQAFKASLESDKPELFIDVRMAAQKAVIYVVDLNDLDHVESYKKTLYSDADAVAESCTNKATVFCATVAAGFVINAVKAWVTKKQVLKHITMIDFTTQVVD